MSLAESYTKNVLSFHKAAFEGYFSMIAVMQEMAARSIQAGVSQLPWMPNEGKVMIEQLFGNLKAGREAFRQMVCQGYDRIGEAAGQRMEAASWQMVETSRQMTRGAEKVGQQMSEVSRQAAQSASEMIAEIMETAQSIGEQAQQAEGRGDTRKAETDEGKTSETDSSKAKTGKIRLNEANRQDLAGVFGIGEATAEKVVGFIKRKGPIRDWEELEEIPGIRNSIISRLKEECRL